VPNRLLVGLKEEDPVAIVVVAAEIVTAHPMIVVAGYFVVVRLGPKLRNLCSKKRVHPKWTDLSSKEQAGPIVFLE
jgi:hypothetical protein